MKTYTTGQVSKICGLKPREVAKLFDNGEINGHIQESKYKRRSHRRISLKSLIGFMIKNGISFDTFGKDQAAQKAILCRLTADLEASIAKAKKRGDIFLKIGQDSDKFAEIIGILGSLENVRDVARNIAWAKVLRRMAEAIEQHTKMCIANSKK